MQSRTRIGHTHSECDEYFAHLRLRQRRLWQRSDSDGGSTDNEDIGDDNLLDLIDNNFDIEEENLPNLESLIDNNSDNEDEELPDLESLIDNNSDNEDEHLPDLESDTIESDTIDLTPRLILFLNQDFLLLETK